MLAAMDTPPSHAWLPDALLLAYDLMGPVAPPPPPPPALRGVAAGRVAKRRPRASRRLPTTYISADPANFRRMVQEVTGAGDAAAAAPAPPVRAAPSREACGLRLPTLDTSAAFFLGGPGGAAAAALQCGSDGPGGSVGPGFEPEGRGGYPEFPTLESWGAL